MIQNGETWIICGGRNFHDRKVFDQRMLDAVAERCGFPVRIVAGGANGADRLAFEWGTRLSIEVIEIYADWDVHGRSAGVIRNQKMLREYSPDCVVAFPGGPGTADMVTRARKANVAVIELAREQKEREAGS